MMISTAEISTQSFSFTAIFKGVSGYRTDAIDLPVDSGKCEFNGITWFLRLIPGGMTFSMGSIGVYLHNSSHGAVRNPIL